MNPAKEPPAGMGPANPPPTPPPVNVPASTPKTGWTQSLTWTVVGGVAITVIVGIADAFKHHVDETLAAAITALVSIVAGYFGQGRSK
jgi:hypothetical protein